VLSTKAQEAQGQVKQNLIEFQNLIEEVLRKVGA